MVFLISLIGDLDNRPGARAETHPLAANCTHRCETRASSDTLQEIPIERNAHCEQSNDPLRDDGVANEGAPGRHEVLDRLGIGTRAGSRSGDGDSTDVDGRGNLNDNIDRLSSVNGNGRVLSDRKDG